MPKTSTKRYEVNNLAEYAGQGNEFQPVVQDNFIAVAHTTIVNRAPVSNALKVVGPSERIPFVGLNRVLNEYGPLSEFVYELDTKDARVRAIGTWNKSDSNGSYIMSTTVGAFVEIRFYGTGLNALLFSDTETGSCLVKVDGGAEGANIYVASGAILSGRNYAKNTPKNVAKGLTLGWHTIRLRVGAASTNGLILQGVDIINESLTLPVLAGTAIYRNVKETLAANSSIAYNSGVVGTRGARVIPYLKDGVVANAVTEVDATSLYLANADHTNEEIDRTINFREFGANRADDFSTLAAVAGTRIFTLDDGVTSLIGSSVTATSYETLSAAAASMIAFTFVGTGLDILGMGYTNTGSYGDLYIDGNLIQSAAFDRTKNYWKVCSGLKYGTHTIKISYSAATETYMQSFVIYKPKKPAIPVGAIELSDYCVLPSYVAETTVKEQHLNIPAGTVKATSQRGYITNNAVWQLDPNPGLTIDLFLYINANGAYADYTFLGSGFDFRSLTGNTAILSMSVAIDGVSDLSGLTTSAFGAGVSSWTPSTGVLVSTAIIAQPLAVQISGLPYGIHTVRFTKTTANAIAMYLIALHIITPLIYNNPKLGNKSCNDLRKFSPISDSPTEVDLSKAKTLVTYDGTALAIMKNINVAQVLRTATGVYHVYFKRRFLDPDYIAIASSTLNETKFVTKRQNYLTVNLTSASGTLTNGVFFLAVFGELQDELEPV